MDHSKRKETLKLLKELERNLSGHDEENEDGEDEDGSFDETEGEHDSSDWDEEECGSDAEVESEQGQHDEKGLMHKRMSPEHRKKMAIMVLKKKMGKKDY